MQTRDTDDGEPEDNKERPVDRSKRQMNGYSATEHESARNTDTTRTSEPKPSSTGDQKPERKKMNAHRTGREDEEDRITAIGTSDYGLLAMYVLSTNVVALGSDRRNVQA